MDAPSPKTHADAADRRLGRRRRHHVPVYETERLLVRPSNRKDARGFTECLDDIMMDAHGWRSEDRLQFLREIELGRKGDRNLAVIEKASGRIVGMVSLTPSRAGDAAGEVGLLFGPLGRDRDFGAEACRVAIPHFFRLGIERLVAVSDQDNVAVRRIAETLGAELVESFPHDLPNGRRVHAVRYAARADDNTSRGA